MTKSHSNQHLWRLLLAVLITCATLTAYAVCYSTRSKPCTLAGAKAGEERNSSDVCPDYFYWKKTTWHVQAVQLQNTGYPSQQQISGKTDYSNGTEQNMGYWTRAIRGYSVLAGKCVTFDTRDEATTWTCKKDTLNANSPDCTGYMPL